MAFTFNFLVINTFIKSENTANICLYTKFNQLWFIHLDSNLDLLLFLKFCFVFLYTRLLHPRPNRYFFDKFNYDFSTPYLTLYHFDELQFHSTLVLPLHKHVSLNIQMYTILYNKTISHTEVK